EFSSFVGIEFVVRTGSLDKVVLPEMTAVDDGDSRQALASKAAQAPAYGPPLDQPTTAKRSIPRASARLAMSDGQSLYLRASLTSDSPIPGRSGAITRTLADRVAASSGHQRRECGVP